MSAFSGEGQGMAPHPLETHVGVWTTRMGAAYPGERAVFRGQDLHRSLLDLGWLEICALGVTGRRISPAQAELLESIWVCSSYPDARIWNNRVVALGATARTTPALAMSAGNAVSEATLYGRRNEHRAMVFFMRVRQSVLGGLSLADAVAQYEQEKGRLPGYGRPIAMEDERIAPTMARAHALGVGDGPHVSMAFEIEALFRTQGRPLRLNLGALVAAFGVDFGFSPRQFSLFLFAGFSSGMQPCYLEGLEKPAGAVFALPCHGVNYSGVGPRDWPVAPHGVSPG